MLVDIGPSTSTAWLIAAYGVFGIGFGFVNAPITNAAVSGMPREQAGVAAAIATTSRQFGQAIGVAIIGAIVASGAEAGLTTASHPAWWTLAALGALVLVLGVLATGSRARTSARRTAIELNPEAVALEAVAA
jgi:MFS family permease